jgi:hypothetical protein
MYYLNSCKWCRKKGDKSYESLFIIPEENYTAKLCSICAIAKPLKDFLFSRRKECTECHRAKRKIYTAGYRSSESGKIAKVKSDAAAVEKLTDCYIKNRILQHIKNPTKEQIEFKRALIFAKRELGMTHSMKGLQK